MAKIDEYLAHILQAQYGEQVRGSIHDAIALINEIAGIKFGTDVTSATSPSGGMEIGVFYFNTETNDLWHLVAVDSWEIVGNLKGAKGDRGEQGEKGEKGDDAPTITGVTEKSHVGLIRTYSIQLSDGTSYDFEVSDGRVEIDSALSTISENPVQNKVVTANINPKADQTKAYGASEWIAGTSYSQNSCAIENGILYRAKVSNSVQPSTHSTEWELISLKTLMDAYINMDTRFIDADSRTRNNITNRLSDLPKASAEQNLRKYGYKIGDYFIGASGYTYTLADMNTYYGGYNSSATVSTPHIGILVNPHISSAWLASGSVTSYADSTLHSVLTTTVLNTVKTDFIALFGGATGLEHLVGNSILNNAIGGWGSPTWIENSYIRALTEVQIYGSRIFGADGFQTGDGSKKLEVFSKYKFNEILGYIWIWLKSLYSASLACRADYGGHARSDGVSNVASVLGLILFH